MYFKKLEIQMNEVNEQGEHNNDYYSVIHPNGNVTWFPRGEIDLTEVLTHENNNDHTRRSHQEVNTTSVEDTDFLSRVLKRKYEQAKEKFTLEACTNKYIEKFLYKRFRFGFSRK